MLHRHAVHLALGALPSPYTPCVAQVCAFVATGAAVSMLLADMLNRVDVVKLVSEVLAKHMAGNAMLPMVLQLCSAP